MALFGAPVALEDAPQRAIRSSLAIHREMAKFSDQLRQEKKDIPSVKMRIGIHTGPVVRGTVGNDLRVEFKARASPRLKRRRPSYDRASV
jgi:class 3 adenylate cyclase